jgi:hypothetical protein
MYKQGSLPTGGPPTNPSELRPPASRTRILGFGLRGELTAGSVHLQTRDTQLGKVFACYPKKSKQMARQVDEVGESEWTEFRAAAWQLK